MEKTKVEVFLIQKVGYVGNSLLWWAKGGAGYTTNIDKAEEFGAEESFKIQQNSRGKKVRHLKTEVFAAAEKHVNSESNKWHEYKNRE